MSKTEIFIYVLMAVILTSVFFFLYENKNACEESGGAYLRGMFGYECVNAK